MIFKSILILAYVAAIVLANLLVHRMGPVGLWVSSFTLIPFDFVLRSYFHETWTGKTLWLRLGGLIGLSALVTYLANPQAENIALASACGFVVAGVAASFFYQWTIHRTSMIKVNGSDVVAVLVDSVVFQLIAFGTFSVAITGGQFAAKALGGLFFWWLLFDRLKIDQKWN